MSHGQDAQTRAILSFTIWRRRIANFLRKGIPKQLQPIDLSVLLSLFAFQVPFHIKQLVTLPFHSLALALRRPGGRPGRRGGRRKAPSRAWPWHRVQGTHGYATTMDEGRIHVRERVDNGDDW